MKTLLTVGTAMALGVLSSVGHTAEGSVTFNAQGELQRPANFREWIFLTSGLGMTYGPNRTLPGQAPNFDNVFVNPIAYRAFMKSGKWPDGTYFILEVRRGEENVSIDAEGRTQGAHVALEAAVKDSRRYPDGGWAYFSFDSPDGLRKTAAPFPRTANCYSCHRQHGAVEWTFTQFYPQQFEVAQKLGTVRADYDPKRKFDQP
jgi:Cytochrome P460